MAVATFRPGGNGYYTGWLMRLGALDKWKEIDESGSHDGDTSYIYAITNHSYSATVVAQFLSGTVSQIKVYAICKKNTGSMQITPGIRWDGSDYMGSAHGVGGGYTSYSDTVTIPTGFTIADADNMEIVLTSSGIGKGETLYCTQAYVEITYTPVTEDVKRIMNLVNLEAKPTMRLGNQVSFVTYNPTWWDNNYARRAQLDFGTNHSTLSSGYTPNFEMLTGYEKIVSTDGAINESNGWIGYDSNVDETYFTWYAQPTNTVDTKIYVKKYTHSTSTFSSTVEVAALTGYDSHHSPSMLVDSNGKIHIFYKAHNSSIKYKRSTNANDITSWTTEATIGAAGGNNTYPRPIEADNGDLYLFCRGDNTTEKYGYFKSTDGGATWDTNATNVVDYTANYGGTASVYCGGAVYKDGRMHLVITFWDWYQGDNKGRAITYIYSDDFTTWYKADGTSLGSTVTYSETEKIFLSGDAEWNGGASAPYYHTNIQGLAIDDNKYPYFTCKSWTTYIREECNLHFARWNGSSWDKTNVSSLTNSKKLYYYRSGGSIYWDNGTVYIYGFVLPDTSEEYFGGELYRWRGTSNGTSWSYDYMTRNSAYGVGQIMTLPKVYNNKYRELIYSRSQDVCWLEDKNYPYIQNDGDDVRIVRQIKNTNDSYTSTEHHRLADRFNAEDSDINFKLDVSVESNKQHPHTYNRYWAYYNNYSATSPPHTVGNVFTFFEGFESYTQGSDISGQGGWTGTTGAFDVFRYDESSASHPNKLYDGAQSANGAGGSPSSERIITQSLTVDKHILELWIWKESGAGYGWLEVKDSSSGKYYRVGHKADACWYKRSDGAWTDSGRNAGNNQYHKYQIKIDSSGVSLLVDGYEFVTDDTFLTSADQVRIGYDGTKNAFYDHLLIKEYVSNAEEITIGTAEGDTTTATTRLAHGVPARFHRDMRLAHLSDMDKEVESRLAHLSIFEAEKTLRLAESIVPEVSGSLRLAADIVSHKHIEKRLAELLDVNKEITTNVANALILEILTTIRTAHTLSGESEIEARFAHLTTTEKEMLKRISHALATDKELTKRIAQWVDPEAAVVKRLANDLGLEVETVIRIMHLAVMTKEDIIRMANDLNLRHSEFIQLAHAIIGNKIIEARMSQLIDFAMPGTERIANLSDLNAEAAKRLMNIIAAEASAGQRVSHQIAGIKSIVKRISNLLDISAEAEERLACWLDTDKEKFIRIAHLLDMDKETSTRLMHNIPILTEAYIRLGNKIFGNKEIVIRNANVVGLSDEEVLRLSNYVQIEAETTKRYAHLLNISAEEYLRIHHKLNMQATTTLRIASVLVFGVATGMKFTNWLLDTMKLTNRAFDTLNITGETMDTIQLTNRSFDILKLGDEALEKLKLTNETLDTTEDN